MQCNALDAHGNRQMKCINTKKRNVQYKLNKCMTTRASNHNRSMISYHRILRHCITPIIKKYNSLECSLRQKKTQAHTYTQFNINQIVSCGSCSGCTVYHSFLCSSSFVRSVMCSVLSILIIFNSLSLPFVFIFVASLSLPYSFKIQTECASALYEM